MERRTSSFLQLIKPGITLSNTMTAVAGYLFAASQENFDFLVFFSTLLGVALVIASACVTNNILDCNIDVKMKRTRAREIASGRISIKFAEVYAIALGTIGLIILFFGTNTLTFFLGVVAFLWYVIIYSVAKRTTTMSTIIGAVCGALPPVAGYTAAMNQLDSTALVLFLILMVWQLPHFYAIAIFRKKDYELAGLPVWSVKYGLRSTKRQIMFWILVFMIIVPLPSLISSTGLLYLITVVSVSFYWTFEAVKTFSDLDDISWAKRTFRTSLIVLLVFTGSLSVSGFLPL